MGKQNSRGQKRKLGVGKQRQLRVTSSFSWYFNSLSTIRDDKQHSTVNNAINKSCGAIFRQKRVQTRLGLFCSFFINIVRPSPNQPPFPQKRTAKMLSAVRTAVRPAALRLASAGALPCIKSDVDCDGVGRLVSFWLASSGKEHILFHRHSRVRVLFLWLAWLDTVCACN